MENSERKDIKVKSLLKEILIDSCQSSTIHAIPNVARSKNMLIITVWMLCFLTCTAYCIYSVVISTQAYLSNQSFISSQIVQDSPANFPAVTLCNRKMADKIRAEDFLRNLFYVNGVPKINISKFADSLVNYVYVHSYEIRAVISGDNNATNITTTKYGFQLKDMLLSCKYNWQECKTTDFEEFYSPYYGNCFTFNKNIIRKATIPGYDYGLTIELFTGNPKTQTEYEFSDGVVIVIHNQSSIPILNSDRILLANGFENDIKVNRNFVSKLGNPYSNCVKDTSETSTFSTKPFDYIVRNVKYPYSQQLCYLFCFQQQILDACGCIIGQLGPNYKDGKICTGTEVSCFIKIIYDFSNATATKPCTDACPLECDFVEYRISSFKGNFPTHYYKGILAKHALITNGNVSTDDIEKSVLKFNVYYETMTYTSITESPAMSAETFFSNIGGTLGLYLGISVLSVVEIVEFVIKMAEILYIRYMSMGKTDIKVDF